MHYQAYPWTPSIQAEPDVDSSTCRLGPENYFYQSSCIISPNAVLSSTTNLLSPLGRRWDLLRGDRRSFNVCFQTRPFGVCLHISGVRTCRLIRASIYGATCLFETHVSKWTSIPDMDALKRRRFFTVLVLLAQRATMSSDPDVPLCCSKTLDTLLGTYLMRQNSHFFTLQQPTC